MKKIMLLFIMFLLLVSCAPERTETPVVLAPVNVCYSALSGTQAVPWYAYEKGLFEKYGLQVNLISMSGGSAAVTSLVSGDMDICQIAANAVVNAAAAQQDVVIISGLINTAIGSLMTQPEITSPEMLKGKTIAIDLGTSPEAIIRLALQNMNLDPNRDVVYSDVGSNQKRAAAMEATPGRCSIICSTSYQCPAK